MSLLFASPIAQMLPFAAMGSIALGALLLSAGRNDAEDVYERAYVKGGGALGDVRVWPLMKSEPSAQGEGLAAPSGMHSIRSLEKATRPWLTATTIGVAMMVAGVAMMVSAYL